jgi:hypothetical protein
MRDRFRLRLDAIQPSQLYISAVKLAAIETRWDASNPDALPPIPIKRLDGQYVSTDGHTRGAALIRAGYEETWAVWDEDDLDWEAYRICVDWCRDAGISIMHDLVDRIVDPDAYERLWLDRCRRMHKQLEERRNQAQDTD